MLIFAKFRVSSPIIAWGQIPIMHKDCSREQSIHVGYALRSALVPVLPMLKSQAEPIHAIPTGRYSLRV